MTQIISAGVLTRDEAVELTARIRASLEGGWRLLDEAYERKVWIALGHSGFRAYLDAEFTGSRTQAYRLLAKAGLTRDLTDALAPPGLSTAERVILEDAVAAEIPPERAREARKELPAARRTAKRVARRAEAKGATPAEAAREGARAAIAALPTFRSPQTPGDDEDRRRRAAEYAERTGRPVVPFRHCATCTCSAS